MTQRDLGANAPPRYATWLALWIFLLLALHVIVWVAGFQTYAISSGVDQGAAHAESRGIGELGDDVIRKAIATQRSTLPFWTALALLGDFVLEPFGLVVRATIVTVIFCSLAALAGRKPRFGEAMTGAATAQGYWVFGLAVQVGLMIALRRANVETSMTLLLPSGSYAASTWTSLRQLDLFALLGWAALARLGWRLNLVRPITAIGCCLFCWMVESVVHISATLITDAGMRLTLIPEWLTR